MKGAAIFIFLALLIPIYKGHAQQVTPLSGQSATPTDSEKQAGNNFNSSFASAEFAADGRTVVRGAPFSAVAIRETTQILSDGRPFARRMVASIYRNSEGSTRYEWGNNTKRERFDSIATVYDAVTGAIYFVDPHRDRADQLAPGFKGAGPRQAIIITPQSPPDSIAQVAGGRIEQLGTKEIEGIKVEGVRVTTPIPAAEMPNKQPAEVVYERWYSQELRRNIWIKVTDPRFGEALFRLTNIDRSEPAGELFNIPPMRKSYPTIGRLQVEPVNIKLERGDKITVDNRTTGRISVIGWDKDFVEAKATSERGSEAVRLKVGGNSPDKEILLKADYANREEADAVRPEPKPEWPAVSKPLPTLPTGPTPPTVAPKQVRQPGATAESESSWEKSAQISMDTNREISYEGDPPRRDGRPIEVDLEVHVPRYAEIEVIKVSRSNVEVTGVETPLIILGDKSTVVLKNVGAVEVRTNSGAVVVENANGLVDVVTTSGSISVKRGGSDVRVLSIIGDVWVECVRGRVNVDNTEGKISLNNIQGDVDASTSNSSVIFAGAIRDDGRYHLKSMSGVVEMTVQDKPPGFTAALSSYRGTIENVFQLRVKQSAQDEETVNRRIIGSYGSGRAQIMLDTFDGKVSLRRAPSSAMKECR